VVSQELKEILEILPMREIKSLAKKHKISTTGNKVDLIRRLEPEITDVDILDVWEQYQDAGDITIHFSIMNNKTFNDFKKNPDLYFERMGLKKFFNKEISVLESTNIPSLQKIVKKRNDDYVLYFIKRGKITDFFLEIEINGASRIQSGYTKETARVILNKNNKLIQLRCRSRTFATSLLNIIKPWFPGVKFIFFTKENAKFWINEENSRLSNIRFKLLGENISSISLTAPTRGDLKEEEQLIEENWERGTCSGFYISADVIIKGKSRKLGLLFNIKQGKIYFRTYSSEVDIRFVISRLINCLGL